MKSLAKQHNSQQPMSLKLYLLFILCSLLAAHTSYSQTSACEEQLQEALKMFEQGHINPIPELLKDCLKKGNMRREKRIDAYRLLTEAHIFLRQDKEADNSLLELLRLDHDFSLSPFSQSTDLAMLLQTFRTKPVFNLEANIGIAATDVMTLQNYDTDYDINELYLSNSTPFVGIRGGLNIEIPLIKNFSLITGADFVTRQFKYKDSLLFSSIEDSAPNGFLGFKEIQYWIDLPILLRYSITFKKMQPYIYVGGHSNWLLSASMKNLNRNSGDKFVQQAEIPLTAKKNNEKIPTLRVRSNASLTAGVGVKFPWGLDYITLGLQANVQVNNVVNKANRYANEELLYVFAYVDNDFRQYDLSLVIGYSKSIYIPKKKKVRKGEKLKKLKQMVPAG